MSQTRHYTDAALLKFIGKLDEGEQTMLEVGGALPAEPFKNLELPLRGSDVARMIELMED